MLRYNFLMFYIINLKFVISIFRLESENFVSTRPVTMDVFQSNLLLETACEPQEPIETRESYREPKTSRR